MEITIRRNLANSHTGSGITAFVLGILGVIMIFLPSIAFGDPFFAIVAMPFAILAIVFGFIARKRGDGYGLIGLALGTIALILAILFIMFFTIAYVEYGLSP